jgi:hypothetical protein
MKSTILLVIFMWVSIWAFTQNPIVRFCDSITSEELHNYVEKLASPEFEGRAFNTNGERKAADYLSGEFNALLLKKFSSNFQTDLSVPFDSVLHLEISNEKAVLKNMVDIGNFSWFFLSNGQKIPLVYAGFGIDLPAYSDYSEIKSEGKFVAVSEGQPIDSHGINLVTGDTTKIDSLNSLSYKIRVAKLHHAKGIFILQGPKKFEEVKKMMEANRDRVLTIPIDLIPTILLTQKDSFSISYLDERRFAELLFVDHDDFPDLIKCSLNQGKSPAGKFETQLSVHFESTRVIRKSQNVLGYFEGKNKEEVIILGAHYDHLGKNDSTYFPGADDNASGVAVLLEIAGAFAQAQKEGYVPEKSILFACWGAEEEGILGSQQYMMKSPYQPENTKMYLNFDMVGRIDTLHSANPNFAYVLPVNEKGKQFIKEIEETEGSYSPSLMLGFEYPDKKMQIEKRSDYLYFSNAGVPSLGFLTGLHPDYHTPKDTPEKLNYDNMANIARLGFAWVWKEAGMKRK